LLRSRSRRPPPATAFSLTSPKNHTRRAAPQNERDGAGRAWFEVSHAEFLFSQMNGAAYHVYRVFKAGTAAPRVVRIANPYRQWRSAKLGVCMAL
jgi:hypothetical protein